MRCIPSRFPHFSRRRWRCRLGNRGTAVRSGMPKVHIDAGLSSTPRPRNKLSNFHLWRELLSTTSRLFQQPVRLLVYHYRFIALFCRVEKLNKLSSIREWGDVHRKITERRTKTHDLAGIDIWKFFIGLMKLYAFFHDESVRTRVRKCEGALPRMRMGWSRGHTLPLCSERITAFSDHCTQADF